jgi:hypothetical protein
MVFVQRFRQLNRKRFVRPAMLAGEPNSRNWQRGATSKLRVVQRGCVPVLEQVEAKQENHSHYGCMNMQKIIRHERQSHKKKIKKCSPAFPSILEREKTLDSGWMARSGTGSSHGFHAGIFATLFLKADKGMARTGPE